MVLVELAGSISGALQQMSNATIIDEKILNIGLNDMNRALLQFDVQFTLVGDMQTNIKKIVDLDSLATGYNKKKIIQQKKRIQKEKEEKQKKEAEEESESSDLTSTSILIENIHQMARRAQPQRRGEHACKTKKCCCQIDTEAYSWMAVGYLLATGRGV